MRTLNSLAPSPVASGSPTVVMIPRRTFWTETENPLQSSKMRISTRMLRHRLADPRGPRAPTLSTSPHGKVMMMMTRQHALRATPESLGYCRDDRDRSAACVNTLAPPRSAWLDGHPHRDGRLPGLTRSCTSTPAAGTWGRMPQAKRPVLFSKIDYQPSLSHAKSACKVNMRSQHAKRLKPSNIGSHPLRLSHSRQNEETHCSPVCSTST